MKILGLFSFLLPVCSTWFGFEAIRWASRGRVSFLEMAAGSFPIGLAVVSVFGLLINVVVGCTFVHFVVQTALFAALALFLKKANKYRVQRPSLAFPSIGGFAAMTFFALFLTKCLFPEKGCVLKSAENEMMLEVSLVSSFAKGCNKWRGFIIGIKNPLFSGSFLFSDYIPTFYTALMKSGGLTIPYAIQFETFFLFLSLFLLEYSLTLRYSGSEFAAVLSMPSVVLIAGFGFYYFPSYRSNANVDFVSTLANTGSNNWGHPILQCFLVSRVHLLSACAVILLYIFLEADQTYASGAMLLLVTFLRPQNGFVALFVFALYKNSNIQKRIGFAPGLVAIFLMLNLRIHAHSPMWNSGISSNAIFPYFSFLVMSLGIHLFGVMLSIGKQFYYRILIIFVAFTVVACLSFQLDQRYNFIIILCILVPIIVSISLSGYIKLIEKIKNEELNGALLALLAFLVVVGCLSSCAGLCTQIKIKLGVWEDDETTADEWIAKNTARTAVFLTPKPIAWNAVATRSGRSLYLGFQNWMPFIRLNSTERLSIATYFPSNFSKIDGVDYLFYQKNSEWENALYRHFGKEIDLVYTNEKYIIAKFL